MRGVNDTTTREGLIVRCAVDDTKDEKGIKVSAAELKAVGVEQHAFHGDWNYNVGKGKLGKLFMSESYLIVIRRGFIR